MRVNGQEETAAIGQTLFAYLQQKQYPLQHVAVEYNGAIVPKEQYAAVVLGEEDFVEIVCFVGGG